MYFPEISEVNSPQALIHEFDKDVVAYVAMIRSWQEAVTSNTADKNANLYVSNIQQAIRNALERFKPRLLERGITAKSYQPYFEKLLATDIEDMTIEDIESAEIICTVMILRIQGISKKRRS